MRHSLRLRIFLMVFLVAAVAIAVVSIFAGQGTVSALQAFAALSAARDQHMAVTLLAPASEAGGLLAVQSRAEELGQALQADVLVVNHAGRVMVDSSGALVGQTLALPATAADGLAAPLFIHDEPAMVVVSYARSPAVGMARVDYEYMDAAAVPAVPAEPWQLPLTAPNHLAQHLLAPFNRSLLLAAGAGAGMALLLTAVLSRRVVGPVEALTIAARRMEQGDRRQRVHVQSRDEIGELARAFNAMADSISVAEQLRRHMVGDIAHELRTPLTNIRGYLEAIRDGVLAPQPELLDSLYEETMLLNRLVDDLQDLALAEAGQLRLERQPVAIGNLIEKTVAAARSAVGPTGPSLAVQLAENLPMVEADAERVGQILRNLLTNALHHTSPDGCVEVQAQAEAGEVMITVRDTGAGIAPGHLPFIFERFYRADPARARASGGAGLGLAIVKQLVEAHGGRVWAESAPGAGTVVRFTLPASST